MLIAPPMSMASATVSLLAANVKRAWRKPVFHHALQKDIMQDSSWADGLRGIASVYVVASHLVLCFARRLVVPCCGDDGMTPLLFQWPVFRLVAQGASWVALFFILSGFVNALKPLKLARAGQHETALTNLAMSSFRRTFRLMLPAAAATVVSWFVCQLGAYELARKSDAYWLYTYTPGMSASWGTALEDLVGAIRATWTIWTINPYDQPQWALIYLLQASMFVFCSLLIVINLTPFYRTMILGIFAWWSFDWSYKYRDPLVGITTFSGILLSEFSLTTHPTTLSRYSPFLTPPLAVFALTLMSFPSDLPTSAPWSTFLASVGPKIFPAQLDFGRTYGSIGAALLVFSVIISPHARAMLSTTPLRMLGKISFPIYLLHGTFMRSLFAWIMFAGKAVETIEERLADGTLQTSERIPLPGTARTAVAVVISMGACLLASYWWTERVEPWFGWITRVAEERMMGKGERGAALKSPLPYRENSPRPLRERSPLPSRKE